MDFRLLNATHNICKNICHLKQSENELIVYYNTNNNSPLLFLWGERCVCILVTQQKLIYRWKWRYLIVENKTKKLKKSYQNFWVRSKNNFSNCLKVFRLSITLACVRGFISKIWTNIRLSKLTSISLIKWTLLTSGRDMHNQNGAPLTHWASKRLGAGVTKLFLQLKKFQLVVNFNFATVSSNKHPRYLTLECCLICIP